MRYKPKNVTVATREEILSCGPFCQLRSRASLKKDAFYRHKWQNNNESMLIIKSENNPSYKIISCGNTSTPSPPTRCVRNLWEHNFRERSRGRMRWQVMKCWCLTFFRIMFNVLRRESLSPHLDFISSPLIWLFMYSRGHCLKCSEGNLLFIKSCKIKNFKVQLCHTVYVTSN